MLPRIISFAGRAGSGKDVLAKKLEERGYIHIKFADELKNLVCDILDITRKDLENTKDEPFSFTLKVQDISKIHNITGVSMNDLNEFCGVKLDSQRELMQFIGTDIIRRYIPDWHIRLFISKIESGKSYVNSDLRFKNEFMTLRDLGATTVYIHREGTSIINDTQHVSETELTKNDMVCIDNDGTINDLYEKLDIVLNK